MVPRRLVLSHHRARLKDYSPRCRDCQPSEISMLPLSLFLACLPVAHALSWAYAPIARKTSSMQSGGVIDGAYEA